MIRTHKVSGPYAPYTMCGRETNGAKFHVAIDWRLVDCLQCRRSGALRAGYRRLPRYEGRSSADG